MHKKCGRSFSAIIPEFDLHRAIGIRPFDFRDVDIDGTRSQAEDAFDAWVLRWIAILNLVVAGHEIAAAVNELPRRVKRRRIESVGEAGVF